MISNKAKMFGLIAIALTASGCGGGGAENSGLELPVGDLVTTTEATDITEVSDSTAIPVASVSSVQMDSFVDNPLVTAVPAELNGTASTGLSKSYITNPLINN